MVTAEPLAKSVWSRRRWLVLAPHPDDETIGAGALVAHAAAEGRLGGIVYLTDGTGSHPSGMPGLASVRRREARRAVRRLTARRVPIDHVGWRDAHPHDPDSARFARDASRLGAAIRRRGIDAVAVTGPSESHCDHVAAFRLAEAAIRRSRRDVALFAYAVWSAPLDRCARRIRTRPLAPGRRRYALRAHRSQLSPAYGAGFRLPRERQAMPPADTLVLQGRHR